MSANLAALAYLVAGVLFILALRGLSHPTTSRRGNLFGMIGMAIAVATTLAAHPPAGPIAWVLVIVGVAIGGGIGAVIARRVPMTSMPELVAAFHSLVGMAAVLVAAGALYAPAAFGIGSEGAIHGQSLVEMSLGCANRKYSNELYVKADSRKPKAEFVAFVAGAAAIVFTLPKDELLKGVSGCMSRMGIFRGDDVSIRFRRLDMNCTRTKTDAAIAISRGLDQ